MYTHLFQSPKTHTHTYTHIYIYTQNISGLRFTWCVFRGSALSYFEAVPTFRHTLHSPSSEFTLTMATGIWASSDSPRYGAEVKNLGMSGSISPLPTCMPSWGGRRQLYLLPLFYGFRVLLLLNRENQSYIQNNELWCSTTFLQYNKNFLCVTLRDLC